MNKIILIGNVTRNIESSKTSAGVNYSKFSLAVNHDYKGADGQRGVDFIPVVAWRGIAELASKYLVKGSKVCIVGSLKTHSYENKDGTKVYEYEVVADELEFIGKGKGGDNDTKDLA